METLLVTGGRKPVTVVEREADVPKGEAIARHGVATVLAPCNLERFGCVSVPEFAEALGRILEHARMVEHECTSRHYWADGHARVPDFACFKVLKAQFIERMEVVNAARVLDKETRRAWVALRNCLVHYVAETLGESPWRTMQILLGRSNTAEAWTDGKTYIAIELEQVKKLTSRAIEAVGYILSLVDHELAHEGDSVGCGHDEAFLDRYHELSLKNAALRQRTLLRWVRKYGKSLADEGKPGRGRTAAFQRALAVAAHQVEKRWLPGSGWGQDDTTSADEDPVYLGDSPELMKTVNARLSAAGVNPPPTDWLPIIEEAQWTAAVEAAKWRSDGPDDSQAERAADLARQRDRRAREETAAAVLGVTAAEVRGAPYHIQGWLFREALDPQGNLAVPESVVREEWARWKDEDAQENLQMDLSCSSSIEATEKVRATMATTLGLCPEDVPFEIADLLVEEDAELIEDACRSGAWRLSGWPLRVELLALRERHQPASALVDHGLRHLCNPDESAWALKRNAAAAGFDEYSLEEYLQWRAGDEAA